MHAVDWFREETSLRGKSAVFSAHFGLGGAVSPHRILQSTSFRWKDRPSRMSSDRRRLSVVPGIRKAQASTEKARWGKDGGPGGKETPLRASQGGFLPPGRIIQNPPSFCSCPKRRAAWRRGRRCAGGKCRSESAGSFRSGSEDRGRSVRIHPAVLRRRCP